MEIKKDVGQDCLDMLDELEARLSGCVVKAENAVKRNAQLHLMINSGLLDQMKQKAEQKGISLSEWCRQKLTQDSQLDRIEKKIERLLNK